MSYPHMPQTSSSSKANTRKSRALQRTDAESLGPDQADTGSSNNDEVKVYEYHNGIIKQWKSDTCSKPSFKEFDYRCFENGIDDKNFIHRAIQHYSKVGLLPDAGIDFIELLVVKKPELFTAGDYDSKIPIFEAAKLQVPLLFRVINLLLPDKIVGLINRKCNENQERCPLLEVAKTRREHCRKTQNPEEISAPKTANLRRQATFEWNMGTISDCIHDEVDAEQLIEEDSQLRRLLQKALSTSRQQALRSCLHNLLNPTLFDPDESEGTHLMDVGGLKIFLSLFPDSFFTEPSLESTTALHMAVRLYEELNVDYNLVRQTIEVLVERYPRSIFTESNDGKTAYRFLKDLKDTDDSLNEESRKATEELFKRTCIGFQEYTKAGDTREPSNLEIKRKFLYWDTMSECQFSLNLTGESITLDKSYIKDMEFQSGIRFETVLDSVILPYWNPIREPGLKRVEPSHESQLFSPNKVETTTSKGEDDPYVNIFEWLWANEVRKIFTVEVDDRGPEPHSNAAIRHCLRGKDNDRDFEVSVFKWKKLDICSETISIAAPKAREVWLYCSGNTAILRSWACCSGLAKLHHLEKLVVNVFPKTLNDKEDCKAYELKFLEKLLENCRLLTPQTIQMKIHDYNKMTLDENDMNTYNKLHAVPEAKLKSKDWVNRLKEFKSFIINLPKKPSIRVALLDDGAKLTALKGKQIGESFCPGKPAYFVGPCEHGTEMARCIREICPMAELYIARLDNSGELENQKFTIMSCHQALRWAIDMKVDVISMSWSFRKKGSEQDEHEKTFINLVKEAIDKNIILFGSLPDRGPGERTHEFAPVGLDGVIKIGSATPHGESVAENLKANPDFLLPGESLDTKSGNPHRGSSYATAYASGLAALALYVVETHHQLAQLEEQDHLYKALGRAKRYSGMKTIFNRLSRLSPGEKTDKGAFVQPYEVFGQDFSDYETNPTDSHAKSILERIINHMLPPEIMNSF